MHGQQKALTRPLVTKKVRDAGGKQNQETTKITGYGMKELSPFNGPLSLVSQRTLTKMDYNSNQIGGCFPKHFT